MMNDVLDALERAEPQAPRVVYLPLAAIAGLTAAKERLEAAQADLDALLRSVGLTPGQQYHIERAPDMEAQA